MTEHISVSFSPRSLTQKAQWLFVGSPFHLFDMFTLGSPCLSAGLIVPFSGLPTGSCLQLLIAHIQRLPVLCAPLCVLFVLGAIVCGTISKGQRLVLSPSLQIMDKALLPSVTLIVGCGVSSLTLLLLIIIYVSVWK